MKKTNLKFKKLLIMLGVSTMAVSLGAGTAYADSPSDNKQDEYQKELNEHKNLQAYTHPLIAASLTISKGQDIPNAQTGVANWSTLPTGTTAYWDTKPVIDKAGTSYGTIIVNFPDKSASTIAVYVTVNPNHKDSDATKQEAQKINNDDLKADQKTAQAKVEAKNNNVTKSTQESSTSSENNESDQEPVAQSSSQSAAKDSANDHVIVKDVKTEYNTDLASQEQPTSKNNETDQIATDTVGNEKLPQTQGKNTLIAVISGIAMTISSIAIVVLRKLQLAK